MEEFEIEMVNDLETCNNINAISHRVSVKSEASEIYQSQEDLSIVKVEPGTSQDEDQDSSDFEAKNALFQRLTEIINSGPTPKEGSEHDSIMDIYKKIAERGLDGMPTGFLCAECGSVFPTSRLRNRHMKKVHNKKQVPPRAVCSECNKTFRDTSKLNRHKLTHTGRLFKCEVCLREFSRKDHLTKHQTCHGPSCERKYKCSICNKGFVEKNLLTRHLNTHTGDRPYECDQCDAKFFSDVTLRQHVGLHSEARPFLCSTCGKDFKRKATLKIHIRTHTKERPYECELCEKRFVTKSSLTAHTRIHTGEMPYDCGRCGERFSRGDIYKYHINRKTDCRLHKYKPKNRHQSHA